MIASREGTGRHMSSEHEDRREVRVPREARAGTKYASVVQAQDPEGYVES